MLFLDSSDPGEIRSAFAWGVVAGVTTNPMILARDGATSVEARAREVLDASTGPVSLPVLSDDEPGMLAEAERLLALEPERVVVKVPFGEIGLRVTHALARRGAQVNLTACMSFPQAYLGALAGARYVSVLAGRVRDMGYDARAVLERVRAQLDREALEARLLVASVRHPADVTEALAAGAHVVTVTPPVLRKMLHNPKTDETVRELRDAWTKREP